MGWKNSGADLQNRARKDRLPRLHDRMKEISPLTPSELYLKETAGCGWGVYAGKKFVRREKVLTFGRAVLTYDEIDDWSYEDQRCIQIGEKIYLGPSGGYDDYVNHSCEPTSGLRIVKRKVSLIAIRNIEKDEEITFDYSTCMDEDHWQMDCNCGSPSCRGRIRDFKYLPKEVQERYLKLGVVPQFIVRRIRGLV